MGRRSGHGRSAGRSCLALASLEQGDLAGAGSAQLERALFLERRASLGSRDDGDRTSRPIVDQHGKWRGELRIHQARREKPVEEPGNLLPKGQRPATTLNWMVPEQPNALERNRARAYQVAYATMVAYADLLKAFDYIRRGELTMSVRFIIPERRSASDSGNVGAE